MSSAIAASAQKAKDYKKRIRDSVGSLAANGNKKATKIAKLGVAAPSALSTAPDTTGQDLDYLYRQGPKDSIQSTSLTSSTTIDFEIKNTPNLKTKDGDSWFVVFTVANTDGTNSVTPSFVESFLDIHSGIQFLMNQRQICPPFPMMQVLLENLERFSDLGYQRLCTQMNHDHNLANPAAITAGSSIKYRLKIPTIFPRNESFWLGAIDGIFTIRLTTQTGGSVSAGTGVLALTNLELEIDCIQVADSEIAGLKTQWADKVWKAEETRLNEVPSQVVTSTGQYLFQLQALKDQAVSRMISWGHASRTSFTGGAYFTFLAPDNSLCNTWVQDKSGAQIFTSNKEQYGFNRYIRQVRQYGQNTPLPNVPLILHNPDPDLEDSTLNTAIPPVFVFTGDEYLVLENFGSNATTMYVDTLAFIQSAFGCKNGNIYKL